MANFCPNCGNSVSSSDAYCPNCGCALNASGTAASSGTTSGSSTGSGVAKGVVGTLVAVTLLNGLTRNLYYYGGRYYMDPYCRNPYMGGIIGRPRPIGGPRPHGPMIGGPRGGMGGPHGGPHGGMGGPHGGGPGGRR